MKIFYKLSVYLFLLFTIQHTIAQNTIVFGANEVDTATNFDFDILLNNTDEVSAIQFDITYNNAVLELMTGHLVSSRAENHSLAVSNPSAGVIRVLLYSDTNAAITGNSGNLLTLKLKSKTLPGTFDLNYDSLVVSSPSQNSVTTTLEKGTVKVVGAILNVITSEINFERVPIGNSPTKTIGIKNDGNSPLELSGVNSVLPFSIQDVFPIEVAPQATKYITLNIDSANKYKDSETIIFQNNDPDPLRNIKSILLKAEVYAVNEIKIGSGNGEINTEIKIPVVIENMEPFTGFQFDVKLPNNISYVSNSLTFSDRLDGHSMSASLINGTTIRFLGYSTTNKNFKGIEGEVFSFRLKPNVSSGNYQLRIEEAILTHVSLGDIVSDVYNGSIRINAPRLSLNTDSINYGDVSITETKEATIRLSNYGNAQLIISEVIYDNTELGLDITLPLTIEAGQSKEVNLTFSPTTSGEFLKTISFRHNAADTQTILNISATKFSPNFIKLENQEVYREENSSIQIALHNNEQVRAVQFDMEVPMGISLDLKTLEKTTRTNGFSITGSKIDDLTYRIILYTTSQTLLEKDNAAIFKAAISVDKSVAFGAYEFNFSNVIISDVNNANIQSISLETGTLNVTPRPITITADAATKVYGEADPALTYQITSGSLVSGDVLNGSVSRAEGEEAGDYAITSTLSNANYEITFVPASLSITAKLITITADAATKVYGESDPALTYQITSGSLVSGDVLNGSVSRAEGEDVGDYAITSALSNANYEITVVPASLSITAKLITITADPATKVYGEADPALTYQITSGSLVSGDVLNGSVSRAEGEDVGDYAITSTLLNANYEVTFVPASLSITSKLITITADAVTKVYGESDPALTYQITSGSLVSGAVLNGSLSRAEGEDVGDYAITSALSNANYEITVVPASLSITAKLITITGDAVTKVYGESDPALTYQITSGSLVSGAVLNGSLSRAEGEDVGDYAITSALSNANYEITVVPASLSITAKLITITADPATKVYGESDPALTYQITSGSLEVGDVLNGSVSRAEGEDVGDYAITSALSNANYEITVVPASLSITAKLITITADAVTKVYGESDPALTYQITSGSLVSGDVLNGSVSRAEGEEAGDYAITSTLSNANYEITFIEAVFTISGTLDLKEENLIRSISVYPNPTSSFLKIEINNSLKVKNLLFYNLLGKEILKITKDYGIINISKFATGIYFLKINTEKGAIIKKVIKE